MRHLLLDSSPLGLLSSPVPNAQVAAISGWAISCLTAGDRLYIPEVTDYELRRELLRAGKSAGLAKLSGLQTRFRYLPITTPAMVRAAALWAQSRQSGTPTGDPKKLDIDVILAASEAKPDGPLQPIETPRGTPLLPQGSEPTGIERAIDLIGNRSTTWTNQTRPTRAQVEAGCASSLNFTGSPTRPRGVRPRCPPGR